MVVCEKRLQSDRFWKVDVPCLRYLYNVCWHWNRLRAQTAFPNSLSVIIASNNVGMFSTVNSSITTLTTSYGLQTFTTPFVSSQLVPMSIVYAFPNNFRTDNAWNVRQGTITLCSESSSATMTGRIAVGATTIPRAFATCNGFWTLSKAN
jgi:hypothetical protein